MRAHSSDNVAVYSTIIDYKRSIGITQWTVLSIFVTASEAILALSLGQNDRVTAALGSALAVMIYWLGFLLYNRYRGLNAQVSNYLLKLESQNEFAFQQHLNAQFHTKGFSTRDILIVAGILYSIFAILTVFL